MIKGFVRVKAIDFDTLNNQWTVKIGGCDIYTTCLPDKDQAYVWARIEDDGLTGLPILSREDAITQGMVED